MPSRSLGGQTANITSSKRLLRLLAGDAKRISCSSQSTLRYCINQMEVVNITVYISVARMIFFQHKNSYHSHHCSCKGNDQNSQRFGLGDVMMCEENATLHKRTKWAQSVSTWAVTLVPLVTSIFYWLFVACSQGSGGNQCSQCNRCKRFKRCKRCKQSNRCQPCRAGTDSAGNANENLEEPTNICKYV